MAGSPEAPKMKATLSLTGVTVNAMALIAPGAFLWITFVIQAGYVYPSGMAMWAGIFFAIMLAYATAISYAELSKLFPGAGSSYLFAEQAFLNTTHAYRFSRIAKFVIGWSSHLYYWVYPGVMVATMGVMIGYIVGNLAPGVINPAIPGPVFMAFVAIIFAYLVAWIAYKGVNGSTNVNLVINIIQICALLFFSALAIAYRLPSRRFDGPCARRYEQGHSLFVYRRRARAHQRSVRCPAARCQLDDVTGDDRDFAAGGL